jgi:pyrroline-5-carboxylate reductase
MMSVHAVAIGFIGAGNIGSAIARRLAAIGGPKGLLAFDIDSQKTESLVADCGVTAAVTAEDCAERADIIIIAVKPDAVESVLTAIWGSMTEEKILVSVAAGVTIRAIEKIVGTSMKVVRAMPNTPALVGEGMTVLSPNKNVDERSIAQAEDIFSSAGLSGSGPAYAFAFIQALADGGVKLGIPRDKAIVLAAQAVLGAAKYVLETGEDPAVLRGRVASPGGTTIEGIHVLARSGFAGVVMDAVEQAALKSKKLGEE